MFALTVAFDDALKVFVAGAAGSRLDTFLEALCESGGAAGEVIAKIATFCSHLVGGVKKRDTNDADGEWKHKFEGSAHAEASERDERIPDNVPALHHGSCGSSNELATG